MVNKFKIICLVLVMVVLATTLTGCVSWATPASGLGFTVDNGELKYQDGGTYSGAAGLVVAPEWAEVGGISDPSKVFGLISFTRQLPLILYQSIFGSYDDPLADPPDTVTLEPSTVLSNTVSGFDSFVQGATGLTDTLKTLALAILLGMWAINFVGIVVNEKFTMEALLKGFMQFVCGALLVDNAGTIVGALAQLGTEALNMLGDGSAATVATAFAPLAASMAEYLKNVLTINMAFDLLILDPFVIGAVVIDVESIMLLLLLAVPFYLQIKLAFKIVSVVITRSLELYVRIALAPIPLAFAASNGFGPETIRYFRSTMACALQPTLMMAGCAAIPSIATAIGGVFGAAFSGIPGVLALCATYIIISTYFGETKQLAHSIIGG
ncbi:MAG: hypothetical protein IJ419_09700 [Agathobacter sp.]|nr:hypothetical protein [Agathobacter sp.]